MKAYTVNEYWKKYYSQKLAMSTNSDWFSVISSLIYFWYCEQEEIYRKTTLLVYNFLYDVKLSMHEIIVVAQWVSLIMELPDYYLGGSINGNCAKLIGIHHIILANPSDWFKHDFILVLSQAANVIVHIFE